MHHDPAGKADREIVYLAQRRHYAAPDRGLSTSFNPSPSMLRANTVIAIAVPGSAQRNQAVRRSGRPSPIMLPQLIRLGSPMLRKDRPASVRIALATITEV